MQKKAILILVVILVVGGGAYAIFHKPSKSNTPSSSTASNTAVNNTNQSASNDIIQTKSATNVGQYLANSDGNALYTYGLDTTGVSNCSGSCITSWPIYAVLSSTTLPANVTIITRSDGSRQYAYKGMPLYTFVDDSSGQVTGDGISNFHIAKP